jgi:cytoskeletal protein CcmA (bactofilin family)
MKKSVKTEQRPVTTIIGQDTVIAGTITVENSIRIDGTLIGGITANGTVMLSTSGIVTGNVVASNAVVAGTVEGDMWIKEKAWIESTGKIHGDITTKILTIDEDAVFQGMSIMTREVEAPQIGNLSGEKGQSLLTKNSESPETHEEIQKKPLENPKKESKKEAESLTTEEPEKIEKENK